LLKNSLHQRPSYQNEYVKPTFIGGDKELFRFLGENIIYPKKALKNKIEGRVVVEFIVKKDGSISNPKIIRSLYPECDLEALRVIKFMPNWNPGLIKGEPTDIAYTLPISFNIERR
jgi:TonB family protein